MNRSVSVPVGAFLTVAMRWSDRLIGVLSTIILARILIPEDFGIIAMASIVIGLINVFLDLGVNIVLIQNKEADQTHYDTAWTLRILQAICAAALLVALAPLAADYFHDERVTLVLRVLSINIIIGGFQNIGIVDFQKYMEFGQDFKFFFYKRIIGFIVVVSTAYLLQSYWALVIGMLATSISGVVLSYIMSAMRPKFSLVRFGEIFNMSQWILVNNIGTYLHKRLDKMLVGNRASATVLGAYSLADEIAALPSTELLAPLSRVLFPAFVKVKDDLQELKRVYLLALGVQALVGIPAGIGLALVSREVILLMLGEKWDSAIPFLAIIGYINIVAAISASGTYVMYALGKFKAIALLAWTQIALILVGVLVFVSSDNIIAIAEVRLAITFLALLVYSLIVVAEIEPLKLHNILSCIWRPLLSGAVMAYAVSFVNALGTTQLFYSLVLKVVIGFTVYLSTLLALWLVVGRPDGGEKYLLNQASDLYREQFSRRRSTS